MSTRARISSADDRTGRDAALVALREVATESGQVIVVGISLTAAGPVVHTKNHAGLACDHHLDYPASLDDLTTVVEIEDESAVVRSEMCAATLAWMSDHGVPTSGGFEEFFRWAVFGELLFDDDGLALLGPDAAPGTLPVGWDHEPRRTGGAPVVEVELERPHRAEVRETTWLIMRWDGWSAVRIGSLDRTATHFRLPPPPDFMTVRPDVDSAYFYAWFRNEDVEAASLIDFVGGCPRYGDN
jgi:hypothetical protein